MITPSYSLTASEQVLPKLALDFTTANLDSRITFTRALNTATRFNSNGEIEIVLADTARFDYDPVTKVCNGLLIEESRTNSYINSFITKSLGLKMTYTDGDVAPDPNQFFVLGIEDTTLGEHYFQDRTISGVITSGQTYTFSVYAKLAPVSSRKLRLRTVLLNTGSASFDLSTASLDGMVGIFSSQQIKPIGNGVYRCSGTFTATATGNTAFRLQLLSPTGASYTGDGVSGIQVWGAQVEEGAFPTSYIPTEATAVTRNADVATMTGTNFSDWYSAGAGGVVAQVLPSTVSGTRPAVQFDDATANEVIALRGNTTNPELVIVDGGSPQAQIDAGTIAANTAYNLGAAWNTDNCASAVNGGAAVTDTTATIPTVTQARLGSDGTNYLNGNIQTLRYWPQRIINAEVQAFSK
jgi:hypothetical protein